MELACLLGKQVNAPEDEANLFKELSISGVAVTKSISDLYNKGKHVYMDNWKSFSII